MKKFCIITAILSSGLAAHGAMLLTSISAYAENRPPFIIEHDGASVKFAWSAALADQGLGYAYGSLFTGTTDVAMATGVTDIAQITDASAYTFTNYTPVLADGTADYLRDATANGGVGTFLILRNKQTDIYGVLRIDDIFALPENPDPARLSATAWLETTGGTDFSQPVTGSFTPVPEPAAYGAFASLGLFAVTALRAKRQRRTEFRRHGTEGDMVGSGRI